LSVNLCCSPDQLSPGNKVSQNDNNSTVISGHENSTSPFFLTSGFGCRTSGNIEIYIIFSLSLPFDKQDK